MDPPDILERVSVVDLDIELAVEDQLEKLFGVRGELFPSDDVVEQSRTQKTDVLGGEPTVRRERRRGRWSVADTRSSAPRVEKRSRQDLPDGERRHGTRSVSERDERSFPLDHLQVVFERRLADPIVYDIYPLSSGDLENLGDEVLLLGVVDEELGPVLLGQVELCLGGRGSDDVRADVPEHLTEQEADTPSSGVDQDVFTLFDRVSFPDQAQSRQSL